MLYELHLTTSPEVDLEAWVAICRGLDIKPLDIRLSAGENPRQIMMAARYEGAEAGTWVRRIRSALEAAGFPILREKLEIPLDRATDRAREAYHEAHVKALVPPEFVDAFALAGRRAGWIMSWNALYPGVDGYAKVYLTRRASRVTALEAAQDFRCAFADLGELPGVVRMEMETVLADSAMDLDAGWAP